MFGALRLASAVRSLRRFHPRPSTSPIPCLAVRAPAYRLNSSSAHPLQADNSEQEQPVIAPSPVPSEADSALPVISLPGDTPDAEKRKIILRDYQEEAIKACLKAFAEGKSRLAVSSPTGSGKTTMFIELIRRMASGRIAGERLQTLILVGSVQLANQTVDAARANLGPGWLVELEQGNNRAIGFADVTVATYHSLNNADRLKKFDPKRFGLIIVDEAHHSAAASYVRILHHFNQDVKLPPKTAELVTSNHGNKVPIVGFSATFSRHDGVGLDAVYEKIVYHRTTAKMMQQGWLSPMKSTAVKCDLGLRRLKTTRYKDFSEAELSKCVVTPEINSTIVAAYLNLASMRRSTVIFCVNVVHVESLAVIFKDAGIDARCVTGDTPHRERVEILDAFRRGDFPVLLNCQLLTEGTDIPSVDCVIIARPTMSPNLMVQMVGRGLRLSPETGKKDCHVINLADNAIKPHGLAVLPTLFGTKLEDMPPETRSQTVTARGRSVNSIAFSDHKFDPRALLTINAKFVEEGDPFLRAAREAQEQQDKLARDVEAKRLAAWVAFDNNPAKAQTGYRGAASDRVEKAEGLPVPLLDQVDPFRLHKAGRISSLGFSDNAWVYCSDDRYILEVLSHGRVVISPYIAPDGSRGAYDAVFDEKGGPLRPIVQNQPLSLAFEVADGIASDVIGQAGSKVLRHDAVWRSQPVSQGALDIMIKLKAEAVRDEQGKIVEVDLRGTRYKVAEITKGHASAYICAALDKSMADSAQRSQKDHKHKSASSSKANKGRGAREIRPFWTWRP